MKIFFLMVLVLISLSPARAALVTDIVPFNLFSTARGVTTGFGPKISQLQALNPFDSSLGQLDRVRVSVVGGFLSISGISGENFLTLPPANIGAKLPIPYTISPTVKIGMEGLTDFFEITSIDHLYNRGAPGIISEFIPVVSSFGFDFTIDEITELGSGRPLSVSGMSGGIPTSLPFYSGSRSDFLDTEIVTDLLLFSLELDFLTTAFAPIRTPTALNARLSGRLLVEYDYTPATDPLPAVPVPASIYLFATALIGLSGFRRLTSAKSPGTRSD